MSAKPDATKMRGEEEEVARRRLFKGTRLCKFFLAGCCSRGEACNFAHAVDDLRDFPDFSKTRLCELFMKSGTCEQGSNCKFAHSRDELRPSYVSSAKARRAPTGTAAPLEATQVQVPAASSQEGEQSLAQLQSFMPATKAGIIHSAAMYTLILQGLSSQAQGAQGQGQARAEHLQIPVSNAQSAQSSSCVPVPEASQTRLSCASPTELEKGGSNWSRQSTAEAVDDEGRRFSRQTTEDPCYTCSRQTTGFSRQTTEDPNIQVNNLSRQTTEEPRRQLPLSQLLSLPEPGESTEPPSPQASRAVSGVVSRAGSSEPEGREGREPPEELKVRLKNTFLHFESAEPQTDTGSKRNTRPSSLPPRIPNQRH